jgi:hypothetical protein
MSLGKAHATVPATFAAVCAGLALLLVPTPARAALAPAEVNGLPASGVSQFTATLNGTIEPGASPASYHFAYGATSTYGSIAPIPDRYLAPGNVDDGVSEVIAGLQPGTTYHYALVAANVVSTVVGPDETFTTAPVPAPTASTGAVTDVTRSTALLAGALDPMGWNTTYRFEYGTSTAYDASWPTLDVDMGTLTGNQPVLIALENLQPGTIYHYRLVATNPGGTGYGTDQAFTTAEYPVSVIQPNPLGGRLGLPPPKTAGTKTKTLTNSHKLANALKACKRKPKKQRAACQRQAHKRYGSAKRRGKK